MIIGSRKSDLAVIQAESVAKAFTTLKPQTPIEFFKRPSAGDLNLDWDLAKTESKGVFTSDFVEHLRNGDCDVVVHSWKDLPIDSSEEFVRLPGPYREDQRDVFFLKKSSYAKKKIDVLTSSPRRELHLSQHLPEFLPFPAQLSFSSIRGNIPTRFNKFLNSSSDGFVVAKAAIDRLMSGEPEKYATIQKQIQNVFKECHWMVLPLSEFPTAAAQGALALELPQNSPYLEDFKLMAQESKKLAECVELERSTHKSYGGGCHQAMGFSALQTGGGQVLFASGQDEKGKSFKYHIFKCNKPMTQKWNQEEVFLSSSLKALRKPYSVDWNPEAGSQIVVSKFEAWPQDAQWDLQNQYIWAAGTKTWKKLAAKNIWVHGCLDSLSLEHKPEFSFLNPKTNPSRKYWLTHAEALDLDDSTGFIKKATYHLKYEQLPEDLEKKKAFFWSSGWAFLEVLKHCPAIKEARHFCGVGRTSEVLKKHISEEQIFYVFNEADFLDQNISS